MRWRRDKPRRCKSFSGHGLQIEKSPPLAGFLFS
jgi:hypothetical protein